MAGATIPSIPALAAPKGSVIDLRYYYLRNNSDQQVQRTSELLEKHAIPAAKRAGIATVGVFSNLIAPNGPFIMTVMSYPSLAAMEAIGQKVSEDKEFVKALEAFNAMPGLGYMRYESMLLRGFDAMPDIEPPPVVQGKPARLFELRTYESNNSSTLRRKVGQFEGGELGIFRRLGIRPVFFGTAMVGRNLPNLTYMVCYDDMAQREKVWKAFAEDPEWLKMRATPGLSNADVLSNISVSFVSPTAFSAIR